jgi:hypothetical protein
MDTADRAWGRVRPALRFLIGVGSLSADWIRGAMEFVSRRPAGAPPLPPGRAESQAALETIATQPAPRRAAAARLPGRLARRAAARLARTRPARRVTARVAGAVTRARGRARFELGRLAVVARDEERRGREVAEPALQKMFDDACTRLAESGAIRQLVREQSVGLTASAIARLRAWAADADDTVERVTTGVFRRRPRGGQSRRRWLPAESTS